MNYQRKPIPGFPGYEIDTNGSVFSKRMTGYIQRYHAGPNDHMSNKWKKLSVNKVHTGYYHVKLSRGGNYKTMKLHKLLALTFILNPDNKPLVCHKDDNKDNNNIENLYWGDSKENKHDSIRNGTSNFGEKSGMAKLNTFKVQRIRLLKKVTPKLTNKKLARMFGVCVTTIDFIVNKKTWKHVI